MPTDRETEEYYSKAAELLCERYLCASDAVGAVLLGERLNPGERILDIGAGSGRDMLYLLERGFDVYGIDSSKSMIRAAVKRNPVLKNRMVHGEIPCGEKYFDFLFDGILCSAVLMHLNDEELAGSAITIASNLRRGGRVLVSVPSVRKDLDAHGRDTNGRLFVLRNRDVYSEIFSDSGLRLLDVSEGTDSLGRDGIAWLSMLFELD